MSDSLPRVFGPYILTKSLGSDPLGETYRAGTAAGKQMRPFMLLRAYTGAAIDKAAMLPAMETAVDFLDQVKGPAVAKGQVLGVVDDGPFSGIEYVPGRTLDKLFNPEGQDPVALPIEHALLITEKILVALEAFKPFVKGTGAPHGFLVPAFISVSNDGDTRVFGAGLGRGLLPSLKHEKARAAFAGYIAPEVAASGTPTPAGDVYSAAAIMFEGLCGRPPAEGAGSASLEGAVLALNGNPLPDDIKRLLNKGLVVDPARRETDVVAYRKELGKLLYGGPYAPSTFNLAFFMHHHFEKSIEKERKDLTTEEQIDAARLVEAEAKGTPAKAPAAPKKPQTVTIPSFGGLADNAEDKPSAAKKSSLMVPGIVGAIAVVAIGAFLALRGGGTKKVEGPVVQPPTPVPVFPTAVPVVVPTPVIVSRGDPEFERLVMEQLKQEEEKAKKAAAKEQVAKDAQEAKRKVELDKAEEASRKVKEAEEAGRVARDRADAVEAARQAKEAQEAREREDAARAAAAAAVPKVTEGELIDPSLLDSQPKAIKIVKPEPSAMALQRHVSGIVTLRVLVDHLGKAEKIEVMRDTSPKVGLGEACVTALRQWEWSPAMKEGKRVKTWIVVPIPFQKL